VEVSVVDLAAEAVVVTVDVVAVAAVDADVEVAEERRTRSGCPSPN